MVQFTQAELDRLHSRFGISISDKIAMNSLLSRAMIKMRHQRKKLSREYQYTVSVIETMACLWIQTPACRYSQMGRCTVCNYWNGNRISDIISEVITNAKIPVECNTLLINTCGSCLDSYELPIEEQDKLLEWINTLPCRKVILETHADTLNEHVISHVREILKDKVIYFEFGIESMSKEILFYSLNKALPLKNISDIIGYIHRNGAYVITNVLMGAPFLNQEEQIEDAVDSISALLQIGIDYITLFPVNIKKHTLPYFLMEHNMYRVIKADMMVDVLSKISSDNLGKIDVAWYGEHVEQDVISPGYCPKCQTGLFSLLEQYNAETINEERKELVLKMKEMHCDCDDETADDYCTLPLFDRIYKAYELIEYLILRET